MNSKGIQLEVLVHVQGIGDRSFSEGEWAGTKGEGRRMEGFQIQFRSPVQGLGLRYKARLKGAEETPWMRAGSFAGTRGQNRVVQGFAIECTGPLKNRYDVQYWAHVRSAGDIGPFQNGQFCGMQEGPKRVEAIRVQIAPKQGVHPAPPDDRAVPLEVLVHVQGIGDRAFREGKWAGSKGEGRRLEGFQISFREHVHDLGLRYMAHVKDAGDTEWAREGNFVGSRGAARRVEGFAIKCRGHAKDRYRVEYWAHVQDLGDTGPCRDGDYCGTRHEGRRVEAIRVRVVRKR